MTTVINLWGGPGTGKSTSASHLFSAAKMAGANAELVQEYVKNWAWEGRTIHSFDQLYFLGKQARREYMLYGKVDLVITDSPIYLGPLYLYESGETGEYYRAILNMCKAFYDKANIAGVNHVHLFLQRAKEYNPEGRYHTLTQAMEMDIKQLEFLDRSQLPYEVCSTDAKDLSRFLQRYLD